MLGWAYLQTGRAREGLSALERAVELSPGSTLFLGQLGQAYARTGRAENVRRVLETLHRLGEQRYLSPYHVAYVHTGLGQYDEAIAWLERAYEERAPAIWGIKGSFLFVPLRSHAGYNRLLRKMNLT